MRHWDRDPGRELDQLSQTLAYRTLAEFQRWAIRRLYRIIPFEHYDTRARERGAQCQPRATLGQRTIGIADGKVGPGRGQENG